MENKEKSSLNNRAALYTLEGRYREASDLFEKIIESDPCDLSVLFNYGFNFLQWEKPEKAVEVFEKILSSSEKESDNRDQNSIYASILEDCGTACYDAGLYREAEKYYLKAEEADPDNSILMNHIGVLYFVSGRIEDAEKYFEKAVEYNEENIDAWFNLADTCEVLGKTERSTEAGRKFSELENEAKL